jgi:putative Ca2+/H+ antiporter (TMEM165/GDT1 family)
MEAFLVSTLVVGLAEIGDKTQILSLMLAARFQRPIPIIFGILFATCKPCSGRLGWDVVRQLAQRPVDAMGARHLLSQRCGVGAVPG